MSRNVLPCTLPKQISVREHDYSIRRITVNKSSEIVRKSSKNDDNRKFTSAPEAVESDLYELKELHIEPMVANIVKVLDVTFSINIPLEEICHSESMLEITPIDGLLLPEELCNVSHLNETCKVCLKDLTDSLDRLPFFDDSGKVNSQIKNISSALESMNVEVSSDTKLPQQICIECYNIFSKMTIFKEICKRSRRALDNMREFTINQLENIKEEDDDLYVSPCETIEIKEEIEEIEEIEELDMLVDQQMFVEDEITSVITQVDRKIVPSNITLSNNDDVDLKTGNTDDSFPCKICAKSFSTKSKCNRHQQLHQLLTCDLCAQVCYSKTSMLEHLKSHTIGAKKLFPCPFCDQRFASGKRLGIHKRNDHPNELYKCPHCPKQYRLKDTFRCHLMSHNADKPHKCTFCDKQFVFRHHWENHLRTHTKVNPFLCNFCGKSFRVEVAFRLHLSSHDPKLYPNRHRRPKKIRHCTICSYSTSQGGSMRDHMFTIHGAGRSRGNFEFVCHVCDKEFRLITSLDNHLRTHNEVRDYHCTYCKASFRKANYLKLHVDGVHLQKRPNKCDQCDAAYLISNDLKRHKMQKHSTDRPFECIYCQKKFSMAIYLKTHMNRIHRHENQEPYLV